MNIDYYFAPNSPWTYLGHQRLRDLAHAARATIRVLPMDLGGKVFPVSGGMPLQQRAPQRQAYRLLELRRFASHLQLPINLQPRFFPVNIDAAARLIVAVDLEDGAEAAMQIAGAALRAVWVEERDIADAPTLARLLAEQALPAERLEASNSPAVLQRYAANTQAAIDAGVFGAPTYAVDGEIFWGQDRLDFLQRRLAGT